MFDKFHKLLIILGITIIIANLVFINMKLFIKTEEAVVTPTNITNIVPSVDNNNLSEKLATLESKYIELNDSYQMILASLSALKMTNKTSQAKTVTKTQSGVIYIPLGGGVSTVNQNWSYPGVAEAYFNLVDYPNAKKITWEGFFRITNSNGEANARLYDATNQVVIANSEIKVSSATYSLKSSAPLTLLKGNNLYQVQLRSTSGNEAFMENCRFKVEY